MRFARWVFLLAGVSGFLMVASLYLEERFFQDYPPAINRPEFYYGFAGVTLAWQIMFLLIASDPIRYRPAMLPAVLEKAGFAVAIPLPPNARAVHLLCSERGGCATHGDDERGAAPRTCAGFVEAGKPCG